MRQQLKDIWSAELLYRKEGRCPLFDIIPGFHMDHSRESDLGMCTVSTEQNYPDHSVPYLVDFGEYLRDKHTSVYKAFERYPDNLFIAGGFLTNFVDPTLQAKMNGAIEYGSMSDIDVFVVAQSPEEAETIVQFFAECVEKYTKDGLKSVYFHPQVVTWRNTIRKKDWQSHPIQLVRRLYSSPDQICLGFDLWPSQVIWGLNLGLKCTLMGLFALKTKCFPLDASKRSTSAAHREQKYIASKGFTMLLPSLPTGNIVLSEELGHLQAGPMPEKDKYSSFSVNRFGWVYPEDSDYGTDTPNEDDNGESEQWHNWVVIERGEFPTIRAQKYCELASIPREHLLKCCFGDFVTIAPHQRKYNFRVLRRFFSTQQEYAVWANLYFIEHSFEMAHEVWTENLWSYVAHIPEQFKNLAQFWKVKEPGEQRFGQNRPTPLPAKELYGPCYVPTVVGISHEIFSALSTWAVQNGRKCGFYMPKDVLIYIIKLYLKVCESQALKALN